VFKKIKEWIVNVLKTIKNFFVILWSKIWNKRIILKAIIYRVVAFFVVFSISMIITGKYEVAFFIGLLEFVAKIIVYYIYELVWKKSGIKEK
jgi:uncharacterized membrane protein